MISVDSASETLMVHKCCFPFSVNFRTRYNTYWFVNNIMSCKKMEASTVSTHVGSVLWACFFQETNFFFKSTQRNYKASIFFSFKRV